MKWPRRRLMGVSPPTDPEALATLLAGPSARPTEHERLMRHTGRPECPIPEHADALRRLGRMVIERDDWKRRALTAEAKLRHPCTGEADAA
jgi:hypothetical protein